MKLVFALLLVIFPGVWSGDWGVTMQTEQCALRGSSPVIQCSYDYPSWHYVKKVTWFKEEQRRLQFLSSSRFQFVGDKRHNCNLKINNIRPDDEGSYYLRFETYTSGWTSKRPAYIFVRDLIASVQQTTVTEGDVVTLTCRSGCSTQRNVPFAWFKEGQPVHKAQFIAVKEDAGSYTCALVGQEHNVRSGAVSLNVQYAPKNVRLSMRPSENVILGSSVIFTCSSEANPAVSHSGYILFKDGRVISSGPTHIISEVQLGDSGQYYCQAGNNVIWKGSRVFQSSKTNVNVQHPPMNVSISLDSAEVTEGSVVNLTCITVANPPAVGYTWYRISSGPSSEEQVGSGPVLSLSPVEVSHSGQYMCLTWNMLGENNSTELLLSVKTKNTASRLSILGGIGVSLLIALMLLLLLYWKKQKRRSDETIEMRERDCSSAAADVAEPVYANAPMFQTCPPDDNDNFSSPEDVIYTTVTIKPKKPSRKSKMQATAPDDSVIYAAISKSS